MKMYSIKYWETNGVEEIDGWKHPLGNHQMDGSQYVCTEHDNPSGRRFERVGGTAFHSREDAVKAAKEKLVKKIFATHKKLKKLNAMKF